MENKVYLDHAATTYVIPEVYQEMSAFFAEAYGNASAQHAQGRVAKRAIDTARARVASVIGARDNEIFFTAGGTESDNWAVKGAALANRKKGKHIVTSQFEHHALQCSCGFMENLGWEVSYVRVDDQGIIDMQQLEKAIRPDTVLVSVMAANNEIGTLQPLDLIGRLCREKGAMFHTDAVQAFGNEPLDVNEMQIDLLSLSAHKIYGPKGTGALYIRNGAKIENLFHGGSQERGRRPGTENVAGIAGLGKAAEIAAKDMQGNNHKLAVLRDKLIDGLLDIPGTRLNGHREKRLSGNVSVSFKNLAGEQLLSNLDLAGIAASGRSACSSGAQQTSHVLQAIGCPEAYANGTVRFTLGRETTEQEIDYTIETTREIVERLNNPVTLLKLKDMKKLI